MAIVVQQSANHRVWRNGSGASDEFAFHNRLAVGDQFAPAGQQDQHSRTCALRSLGFFVAERSNSGLT